MFSTLILQAAAAAGLAKFGAGLGAGIAAIGAGLGIGRIGGNAMDAIAVSQRLQVPSVPT